MGDGEGDGEGETVGGTVGVMVGETVGEIVGERVGEIVGEGGKEGERVGEIVGIGEVGLTVGEASDGETVGARVGERVGETVGDKVGETGLAGSGERVGSITGGPSASPKSQSSEHTFGYSSHKRLNVVSITANPSAPISQRLMPPTLKPPSNRLVPKINETISVSTPEPPQGCYTNFSLEERKLDSIQLHTPAVRRAFRNRNCRNVS